MQKINAMSGYYMTVSAIAAIAAGKKVKAVYRGLGKSKFNPQMCGKQAIARRCRQMANGQLQPENRGIVAVVMAPVLSVEDRAIAFLRRERGFTMGDLMHALQVMHALQGMASADCHKTAERVMRGLKNSGKITFSQMSRKWLWI